MTTSNQTQDLHPKEDLQDGFATFRAGARACRALVSMGATESDLLTLVDSLAPRRSSAPDSRCLWGFLKQAELELVTMKNAWRLSAQQGGLQ